MKLIVILITCVGIVATFILLRGGNSEVTMPTSGTTVVAFGDSLVAGVGSTEGNDFVSLLADRINEPIINLGVSGDTTRDGVRRIDEVLERDPRVVILLLGGNDFLRRIPSEETFSNLASIIETIQSRGAAVVLLGVRGGVIRDEYKDAYEALADTYNLAYTENVLEGLIGRSELMSDPIHPNDAGYRMIADRVYPTLEQFFTE